MAGDCMCPVTPISRVNNPIICVDPCSFVFKGYQLSWILYDTRSQSNQILCGDSRFTIHGLPHMHNWRAKGFPFTTKHDRHGRQIHLVSSSTTTGTITTTTVKRMRKIPTRWLLLRQNQYYRRNHYHRNYHPHLLLASVDLCIVVRWSRFSTRKFNMEFMDWDRIFVGVPSIRSRIQY